MSWIKAKYGAGQGGFQGGDLGFGKFSLHPIGSVICKLRVLHKVCLHAQDFSLGVELAKNRITATGKGSNHSIP